MASYATKQRKILLEFLKDHAHEMFSAAHVAEHVASELISTSAVYRNLAELETQGQIRKVRKSGTREAYYQYVKAECCENQIHLFCLQCEKFIHMDMQKLQSFENQLLKDEGFIVSKSNTVIYGVCKNCAQKNSLEGISD